MVFPDPLEWSSGLEWGIGAAARLINEGWDMECVFRSDGPMFEAVAYAAFEAGILDRCVFDDLATRERFSDDVVLTDGVETRTPTVLRRWRTLLQRLLRQDGEAPPKQLARWASPRDPIEIAAEIRRRSMTGTCR